MNKFLNDLKLILSNDFGILGGLIGEITGANKAARDAERAMSRAGARSDALTQQQLDEIKKAVEGLEQVGVPSIEAQKIALEYAQLGPTALEQVTTDPKLAAAQYESLEQLGELAGPGLTPEDRAEQFMISRGAGREAQARDKAVLQQMAQRGMGGSGAELAARLAGGQAAADRAAMQQAQMVGDRAQARRAAIESRARLAGGMEQSQYGRDTQLAAARDRIEQFNKQQRADTVNRQQMANKALQAQKFQQDLAKQQAIAGARTGTASAYGQQAQNVMQQGMAQAQGAAQRGAAQTQLLGQLGGAAIGLLEDGGIVENGYKHGGVMRYQNGGTVNPYMSVPNSNAGFEDGGMAYTEGGVLDEEGAVMGGGDVPVPDSGMPEETRYLGGDVVPGNSYAGDRVDAKVNSGEMVLNIEQQQRLMDLLRGLKDLQQLGDENIVEPAPGTIDNLGGLGRDQGGQQPPMDAGMPPVGGAGAMIPEGAEVPFAKGGMVPGEYGDDKEDPYSSRRGYDKAPRGIHASLNHEKQQLERYDGEQKARKARIKALETLRNGGK